jgi:hypothetical protein
MKLTTKIIGLLLLFTVQSCGLKNSNKIDLLVNDSKDIFDKYSNDSIRNQIFKIAYQNSSTAPSYVVFKAVDLNSGKTKAICCEAPFLSGAIHREFGKGYNESESKFIDSLILNNKSRVFEFKNNEALKNIGFDEYPDSSAIEIAAVQYNLDYYFKKYGANDSIKSMNFNNDTTGVSQLVFAHLMFECGIITSRDCVVGNYIWFGDPGITLTETPKIEENE